MKKAFLSLSLIAAAAVLLISFDKAGPKEVAKTWLTSFYHMDFDGAKKLSTPDTRELLSQLSGLSSMIPDSSREEAKTIVINITDIKEEGDKATVTYKAVMPGKKEE